MKCLLTEYRSSIRQASGRKFAQVQPLRQLVDVQTKAMESLTRMETSRLGQADQSIKTQLNDRSEDDDEDA